MEIKRPRRNFGLHGGALSMVFRRVSLETCCPPQCGRASLILLSDGPYKGRSWTGGVMAFILLSPGRQRPSHSRLCKTSLRPSAASCQQKITAMYQWVMDFPNMPESNFQIHRQGRPKYIQSGSTRHHRPPDEKNSAAFAPRGQVGPEGRDRAMVAEAVLRRTLQRALVDQVVEQGVAVHASGEGPGGIRLFARLREMQDRSQDAAVVKAALRDAVDDRPDKAAGASHCGRNASFIALRAVSLFEFVHHAGIDSGKPSPGLDKAVRQGAHSVVQMLWPILGALLQPQRPVRQTTARSAGRDCRHATPPGVPSFPDCRAPSGSRPPSGKPGASMTRAAAPEPTPAGTRGAGRRTGRLARSP